jgi:putative pyruvate formate lyase activating enzyme
MWEEPPISGTRGSGTVFFSGCSLRCVFCQNRVISREGLGRSYTEASLSDAILRLQEQGVHNINFVTPTHYTAPLASLLETLKPRLRIPVVWNSGGYESVESLRMLEGLVDVYLPDFKYLSPELAAAYSAAPDYPDVARAAILEMFRQRGRAVFDENGIMKSGVIIRHMMLPGNVENTLGVIEWVAETFKKGDVVFSLMSQYTPPRDKTPFPELDRRLTEEEYAAALSWLDICGITDGYRQELSSAKEEYTPPFDLTGV